MKDISVAYISYGKQVEQTGSYFRQDLYLENLESFWVQGFPYNYFKSVQHTLCDNEHQSFFAFLEYQEWLWSVVGLYHNFSLSYLNAKNDSFHPKIGSAENLVENYKHRY